MEQTRPRVTVLMTVYNGEKYLGLAMDSILKQTFTDFEFLIIDDGSTDCSVEILKRYEDPRIQLVLSYHNMGVSSAANRGLELARGEYIARMDCDDISLPERLEKQVAFMDSHPEVGVCGSWYKIFGLIDCECFCLPTTYEEIKATLFFTNCIGQPTVMMRRSMLKEYGLRYELGCDYAEDYSLWTTCSFLFPVVNIPEMLLHYRVSPTGVGQQYQEQQQMVVLQIHKSNLARLGINHVDEETMEMHENIINNKGDFSNGGFITRAYNWLGRLRVANEERKCYPEPYFSDLLGARWREICRLGKSWPL